MMLPIVRNLVRRPRRADAANSANPLANMVGRRASLAPPACGSVGLFTASPDASCAGRRHPPPDSSICRCRHARRGRRPACLACELRPRAYDRLLKALEDGLCERPTSRHASRVGNWRTSLRGLDLRNPTGWHRFVYSAVCGSSGVAAARRAVRGAQASGRRAELLALLGEVGSRSRAPTVLSLVGENEPTAVQLRARRGAFGSRRAGGDAHDWLRV